MTDRKDVMIAELSKVVAELLMKLGRLEVYHKELKTRTLHASPGAEDCRAIYDSVYTDIDSILNT